jgi:hypothetical protein
MPRVSPCHWRWAVAPPSVILGTEQAKPPAAALAGCAAAQWLGFSQWHSHCDAAAQRCRVRPGRQWQWRRGRPVVRQRHSGGCAAAQRRQVCAIRVVMSDSLPAWRWAVAPLSLTESPAHSAAGEAKPPGASACRLCGRSVTVASSLSAALVSLSRHGASDSVPSQLFSSPGSRISCHH